MYSMVLMAALTTGVDMPDFGRRGGCHGCYGGCYGGWGGCRGGWGGCYGGWGGCYGGWGGWGGGCSGWGGGCYGGYASGGWGGGYGGYAGWGGGYGGIVYAAPVATYGTPMLASNVVPGMETATSMYYNPDPDAGRRATIIVHLPADARLMVDGKATRATSGTRRFISPPLESGQGYHYTLKAEIDRDGEPMTVTKRVDVRAGESEEVTLRFTDLNQSSERKGAPARTPERSGLPDDKKKPERP
jgi:uncharacterized protein (TIGR03000 family)